MGDRDSQYEGQLVLQQAAAASTSAQYARTLNKGFETRDARPGSIGTAGGNLFRCSGQKKLEADRRHKPGIG